MAPLLADGLFPCAAPVYGGSNFCGYFLKIDYLYMFPMKLCGHAES